MKWSDVVVRFFRKKQHNELNRPVRRVEICRACNEFGGHFDGNDFQECRACNGEGSL